MSSFCRSCGASIPHRFGEGRCEKCLEHDPVWARAEIERLRKDNEYFQDECLKHQTEAGRLVEKARAEIARLTRENKSLRTTMRLVEKARAEIERLTRENKSLRTTMANDDDAVRNDNQRLRAGLHEIRSMKYMGPAQRIAAETLGEPLPLALRGADVR